MRFIGRRLAAFGTSLRRFSVEQVGMEAPACFPTNENVFALLRVARIIFESQMANDAAP
jgi:hypothetical protein